MIFNSSRYIQAPLYQGRKKTHERVTIDTAGKITKTSESSLTHRVIEGDTIENLAYKYFGDPTYWWVIADANMLFDVDKLEVGKLLNIP